MIQVYYLQKAFEMESFIELYWGICGRGVFESYMCAMLVVLIQREILSFENSQASLSPEGEF